MEFKESIGIVEKIMPGVYCGVTEFLGKVPKGGEIGKKYRAILSVGWNPTFDNKHKTIVILMK